MHSFCAHHAFPVQGILQLSHCLYQDSQFILSLSGTINLSFTLSNVMTGGGPNGASSVLLQYMYTQGMRNANFGYAMAIAMFTLGLAIVLAMISKKISSEKE